MNETVDLSGVNVLFITLDSLPVSTARISNTPNLNRISKLRVAETSGSYTLPAHIAFFSQGNIPNPIDGENKVLNLDRIWRSQASRNRSLRIGITFETDSITSYYQKLGHTVIGCGGVGFFDPQNPVNILPKFFQEYKFPPLESDDSVTRLYRKGQSCVLTTNINEIKDLARSTDPWFLFINVAETHFPYSIPGQELTDEIVDILEKAWLCYPNKNLNSCILSTTETSLLRMLQSNTLNFIDSRIGTILNSLSPARPTLVIICADHGEELGEYGRLGHGHASKAVMEVPLWVGLINP